MLSVSHFASARSTIFSLTASSSTTSGSPPAKRSPSGTSKTTTATSPDEHRRTDHSSENRRSSGAGAGLASGPLRGGRPASARPAGDVQTHLIMQRVYVRLARARRGRSQWQREPGDDRQAI